MILINLVDDQIGKKRAQKACQRGEKGKKKRQGAKAYQEAGRVKEQETLILIKA